MYLLVSCDSLKPNLECYMPCSLVHVFNAVSYMSSAALKYFFESFNDFNNYDVFNFVTFNSSYFCLELFDKLVLSIRLD